MLPIPVDQFGALPLDGAPEFVSGDVDESNIGGDVDIDGVGLAGDIDAVGGVELGGGWRNCSNVSPEGSLKRLPDSRKSVRQFNGCIGITPVSFESISRASVSTVQRPGWRFSKNWQPPPD